MTPQLCPFCKQPMIVVADTFVCNNDAECWDKELAHYAEYDQREEAHEAVGGVVPERWEDEDILGRFNDRII